MTQTEEKQRIYRYEKNPEHVAALYEAYGRDTAAYILGVTPEFLVKMAKRQVGVRSVYETAAESYMRARYLEEELEQRRKSKERIMVTFPDDLDDKHKVHLLSLIELIGARYVQIT